MTFMEQVFITVKIKDGVNPLRWYANMVGKEIKVYHYALSPYVYCKETNKQIDLNDCEILN